MTNHEILQLSSGATKEEIKKAFFKLAHQHHPDKGGDSKKFIEIKDAYDQLMKGEAMPYQDFPEYGWATATGNSIHINITMKAYRYDPTTGHFYEL